LDDSPLDEIRDKLDNEVVDAVGKTDAGEVVAGSGLGAADAAQLARVNVCAIKDWNFPAPGARASEIVVKPMFGVDLSGACNETMLDVAAVNTKKHFRALLRFGSPLFA